VLGQLTTGSESSCGAKISRQGVDYDYHNHKPEQARRQALPPELSQEKNAGWVPTQKRRQLPGRYRRLAASGLGRRRAPKVNSAQKRKKMKKSARLHSVGLIGCLSSFCR